MTRAFSELQDQARAIRHRYADYERERHGRSWTTTEIALGFVGDVGDLAKLIQADAGVRTIDDHRHKLAHELADCLWSVMTLADQLDIDLEQAFTDTMGALDRHLENSSDGTS